MNATRPPALAVRLMEEAGTDSAVIGDLIEAYSCGRDTKWFWRQAIAASAPSPMNAVRWAIAIPMAYWISVWLSGHRLIAGLFNVGTTFAPGMFIFTAGLVSIASLIVPTRRKLVARTLLGIVIIAMAALIELSFTFERSFIWPPFVMGCAGLLGGLSSYALLSAWFRTAAPRPTS